MYNIGIDLGGTKMAAGVVDDDYKIIGKTSRPTLGMRPDYEIVEDMVKLYYESVAASGLDEAEIQSVGIGCPGAVNVESGILEGTNNLNFHMYPIKDELSKRLKKEVYIENDANAAAYGEFLAGAGRGKTDFIVITLGTGVGSGIIINGKIYSGHNYDGAELGHMVINIDGEPCNCGRYGCWEAYASATALIRQTKEAMSRNPESAMWDIVEGNITNVNGKTAFDAMRINDEAGKEVVRKYLRYVGCGIVNVINIFQPEVVCIGGGISKEGDTILKPIHAQVRAERYSMYAQKQTKLKIAELGNDAGIIGAAELYRLYGKN